MNNCESDQEKEENSISANTQSMLYGTASANSNSLIHQ